MNMKEVRENARQKLKGRCRVCPVCNGRACAGEVPGMGGAGTGESFQENVRALASYKLHLRTLHGVESCDTRRELFGQNLSLPVMAAPMAGAEMNLGGAVTEEELCMAVHAGCLAAGTLGWGGDGLAPIFYETTLKCIQAHGGKGIPTIKPRSTDMVVQYALEAQRAGAPAVAVDVDAAAFPARDEKGGPLFGPKKAEDIQAIVNALHIPLILKGIMTADEAALAASLGVAGIVVSNHGGRVLDNLPGTADALPAIASAVKGKIAILLDGGIRTGSDVLKALALGADAVLVGRPLAVAAVGGGAEGVALALEALHKELIAAMILTGTATVAEVPPSILTRVSRN